MATKQSSMKQYDVFISYGRRDYERDYMQDGVKVKELIPHNPIIQIANALREAGISCWYDQEGVSSNFLKYIKQMIDTSRVMVFVSSEYSNQSQYTADEIAHATQLRMPIIPIKIDGAEFNEEFALGLASKNTIDIYPTNPDKALQELIKCVKKSLDVIKKEDERIEKENARAKHIDEINAKLALISQKEAEANVMRQELRTHIAECEDRQIRKEFSERLEETGALYLRAKKFKRSLNASRRRMAICIEVAVGILVLAGFVYGGQRVILNNISVERNNLDKQVTLLRDSCVMLQNARVELLQQVDSLQDAVKDVPGETKKLSVWPRKVKMMSSGDTKSIYVKCDQEWSFKGSQDASDFTFTKEEKRIVVTCKPNYTTKSRETWCQITVDNEEKPIKVQIIQEGAQDTIQLLGSASVLRDVEGKEGKGLLIRCPFQTNYFDGNISVRAYFYQDGKPLDASERDKKYLYRDPETGEPYVCSQELTYPCQATGNNYESCSIAMPYSKMNKHRGEMTCVVVFKVHNKEVFRTQPIGFSL